MILTIVMTIVKSPTLYNMREECFSVPFETKAITTYLIDGDPKGTQYVFISNKICQMCVINGV